MKSRKKYFFIRVCADSGLNYGMGHVVRTMQILNLIFNNNTKDFEIIFIINNNRLCENYINSNFLLISKSKIIKITDYSKLQKFHNIHSKSIFYLDNLGKDTQLINYFRKEGISKFISFDDVRNKLTSKSLIINSIYSLKKKLLKKNYPKNIKIKQSLKFLTLKSDFSKTFKKSKYTNRIQKVTICTGGADYFNIINTILKKIKFNSTIKINLIIGQGNLSFNKKYLDNLIHKNIKIIKNKNNIRNYFIDTHLVICTGGTMMFESLTCKKLTAVIKNYDHQKYAIKYFKKKNCIIYLGERKKINFKLINKLLTENYSKLNPSIKNIPNELDGAGLFRVTKLIKKFIRN